MTARRNEWLFTVVLLGIALSLSGCFTPNQTPYVDLAHRLRTPEAAVNWTLGQSDVGQVALGVQALYEMADGDVGARASIQRREVLDGLVEIIEKRMTGWPEGGDDHYILEFASLYGNLARISSSNPEIHGAYLECEPQAGRSPIHNAWREKGLKYGLIE